MPQRDHPPVSAEEDLRTVLAAHQADYRHLVTCAQWTLFVTLAVLAGALAVPSLFSGTVPLVEPAALFVRASRTTLGETFGPAAALLGLLVAGAVVVLGFVVLGGGVVRLLEIISTPRLPLDRITDEKEQERAHEAYGDTDPDLGFRSFTIAGLVDENRERLATASDRYRGATYRLVVGILVLFVGLNVYTLTLAGNLTGLAALTGVALAPNLLRIPLDRAETDSSVVAEIDRHRQRLLARVTVVGDRLSLSVVERYLVAGTLLFGTVMFGLMALGVVA